MMHLPIIRATVRVYNPDYNRSVDHSQFQIDQEREVEVVQLNLNSGGMRVRFKDQGPFDKKPKIVSQDIDIANFYEFYDIVAR